MKDKDILNEYKRLSQYIIMLNKRYESINLTESVRNKIIDDIGIINSKLEIFEVTYLYNINNLTCGFRDSNIANIDPDFMKLLKCIDKYNKKGKEYR